MTSNSLVSRLLSKKPTNPEDLVDKLTKERIQVNYCKTGYMVKDLSDAELIIAKAGIMTSKEPSNNEELVDLYFNRKLAIEVATCYALEQGISI